MATLKKLIDQLTGEGSMERLTREFLGDTKMHLPPMTARVEFPEGLDEAIQAFHERQEQKERHIAITAETLQAMLQAMAESEARNIRFQWTIIVMTAISLVLAVVLISRP